MAKPAWGLYDLHGQLVATCRADTAWQARDLFRKHDLTGTRVKRIS